MPAIQTINLTKCFGPPPGGFVAVNNVNLDIASGQIYALVGPTGAGKTTLIKMLVGLLKPTSGQAVIAGFDIARSPLSAKSRFGYVPDEPSGYDYLSGMEFLTFTARLRGLPSAEIQDRIDQLLEIFPLSDVIYRPMVEYSRGYKQKVAFLAAILSKPQIIIIDEPIVGLDPPSIKKLGQTLVEYADKGNSVFFVTHILEFAQNYAQRAGIMKAGIIVKEIELSKSANIDNLL